MAGIEYTDLNSTLVETRFLKFLETPDPRDNIIRLQLTTFPLNKAPDFWCLSYTWGDDQDLALANVDSKYVSIRRNLADALLYSGLEAGDYIWVDALCINQRHVLERNHQLLIMGQIYSQASRTLVWLGKSGPHTELAYLYLRACEEITVKSDTASNSKSCERIYLGSSTQSGDIYDFRPGTYGYCRPHRCYIFEEAMRNLDQVLDANEGLRDILGRPYWARVWIIQEIAKSSHVVIKSGHYQFDLEMLFLAAETIGKVSHRTQYILGAINNFRLQAQGLKSHGSPISLLEAMILTRFSLSKDPRDKVYALLGLTSDGYELIPYASYADDEAEVLRKLSARMLNSRRSNNAMLIALHGSGGRSPMADWVVRPTAIRHLPPWLGVIASADHTGKMWKFDSRSGILRTDAIKIATIEFAIGFMTRSKSRRPGENVTGSGGSVNLDGHETRAYLTRLLQRFPYKSHPDFKPLEDGDSLTDAFARMIRDADKGFTDYGAQYDLDRYRSALKDIGAIDFGSLSIRSWAYNYNSRAYLRVPRSQDLPSPSRSPARSPSRGARPTIPTGAFQLIEEALEDLLCAAGYRLRLGVTDEGDPVIIRTKGRVAPLYQVDQSHLPLMLDYDDDSGDYVVVGEVCFGRHGDGSWWSGQSSLRAIKPPAGAQPQRISIQLDPKGRR